MNPRTRVVVTGMGIVAPNGIGLEAYWDSLMYCRSAIGPISLFDTADIPVKVAGEIKGFDLRDFTGQDFKPHRLARQTQFGLAACKMAIEHAELTQADLARQNPVQLVMGICSGAVDVTGQAMQTVLTRGPGRIRPHTVGACQPHAMGAAITRMLGTRVSVTTLSAACPSGLDALTQATRLIRTGKTDMALIGAADSPLNISTVASFCAAGIPSTSDAFPPEALSRPFDRQRAGVILSEGAGFLVLERLECALARGANPLMEILGGATTTDLPGTHGMEGFTTSIRMALGNAGLHPESIDYVCANACGDPAGDRVEVDIIKAIFGAHAYRLAVSSIRGVTGHPLAPAGMFQVIACAMMMQRQRICPTANLTHPDPLCDLDHVPLTARAGRIRYAMANGHGMGGENSTVVFGQTS